MPARTIACTPVPADRDGLRPRDRRCLAGRSAEPLPACILDIECTQAVQRRSGDSRHRPVPLIAGKDLIIRVHPNLEAAAWEHGRPGSILVGLRVDGAPVPGAFLGGAFALGAKRPREDPRASVNLFVPGIACVGRRAFTIGVSDSAAPAREIASCELHLSFVEVPPLPVDLVPVALDLTNRRGAKKAFPAPPISEAWPPLVELAGYFPSPPPVPWTSLRPIALETQVSAGFSDALDVLRKSDLAKTTDRILVGVVHPDVRNDPTVPVLGLTQSGVSLLIDGNAQLAAHEIGHVLGRLHTPGSGQRGIDQDYPDVYPEPQGSIDEVGFTARTGPASGALTFDAYAPGRSDEYMGGSDARRPWTSAYGYERVLAAMRACGWRRRGPTGCHLLLDVLVESGGAVRPQPSYRISTATAAPPGEETQFTVELRDARGAVLRRATLHDPVCRGNGADDNTPARRFIELIAWHGSTHSLSISREGVVLENLPIGDAPQVTDVSIDPPGGGRNVTLDWALDDPADVAHLIRYTPDDGASWYPVAVDVPLGAIDIDLGGYPAGPACRFEISASRGGGTTSAPSPEFTLDPLDVVAKIARPAPLASVSVAQSIELLGWAFSPDAPEIPERSFRWHARRAGPAPIPPPVIELGTGRRLFVPGELLGDGVFDVFLDFDGALADLVRIEILPAGI